MSGRAISRAFFACLAIVYLLVYPYLQAINNPNENTRVYLTMALVEERSFFLDGMVRRHGWTNDMAKVQTADGPRFASVKGPAVAYLGVPVYAAQRVVLGVLGRATPTELSPPAERQAWLRTTTIVLQLFCVHVPCLIALWLFERVLRVVTADRALRLSAVAAVGLGTNYLAYAFVFVSHALVAVAAFGAFGGVLLQRVLSRAGPARGGPWRSARNGFLVGCVTLLEYQALFVSGVLFAYAATACRTWRERVALGLGTVPAVIGLMVFQAKSFGSAFTPGHRMMDSQDFAALNNKGFFTLGTPSVEAISGLLFDGGYGLFGASPYLLLALLALVPFRRPRDERSRAAFVAMVVFLALVIPVSASSIWRGGWTIGPRYLGLLPPFLAFLAVVGMARRGRGSARLRAVLRGVAAGLAIVSFASLGLVGMIVSTLPEAIARPLPQIAWPFLRAGRVPHHAFEVLGVTGAWPWYLALVAAVVALGLVIVSLVMPNARAPRSGEGGAREGAASVGIAVACAALGVVAISRVPAEARAMEPAVQALFARAWEPSERAAQK